MKKKAIYGLGLAILVGVAAATAYWDEVPTKKPLKVNHAVMQRGSSFWKLANEEVRSEPILKPTGPRLLYRGNPKLKQVLLTFDDGPHVPATRELLEILARKKVKATFFVVGSQAVKHPDLIRAIHDGGHVLANHTFSHVNLTKIKLSDVRTELRATNDAVEAVTGERMRYCRPPGGRINRKVVDGAHEEGLTTVMWTDNPADYNSPGTTEVLDRTLKRLQPGAIVLLHDGAKDTLSILEKLIDAVRAKGYTFVTPDEMIQGWKQVPSRH